jgi:hypothetical protein
VKAKSDKERDTEPIQSSPHKTISSSLFLTEKWILK